MSYIAGTTGLNGEEFCRFDTLADALTWLRDQLDEGFAADALFLFQAKTIPFEVSLSPTITANGLTI